MTRLSPNFTLEEMVFSQMAARRNIRNEPNSAQIAALTALCRNILQPLRDHVGRPLTVSSGFRSPALNAEVGGVAQSQHLFGEAADITCSGMKTEDLFKTIVGMALPYDQLIYEGGPEAIWVHVSYKAENRRGQILRATFPSGGKVLYAAMTREDALALTV